MGQFKDLLNKEELKNQLSKELKKEQTAINQRIFGAYEQQQKPQEPKFVYGDLVEVTGNDHDQFIRKFYDGLVGVVVAAEGRGYVVRFDKDGVVSTETFQEDFIKKANAAKYMKEKKKSASGQ